MFRRLLPLLMALIGFLLDTTVIPMVYSGPYSVPLTVVLIFLIGMCMGRMRGLLYGTLTGLLIDITSGTLGMMTFFYMSIGFMIGLIVYEPGERVRGSLRRRRRRLFWRAVWVFALYAMGEIVLFAIQYFNTAAFRPVYFLNIFIRAVICTALTMLLHPVMDRILTVRGSDRAASRSREVKSF